MLEILSETKNPRKVQPHLKKCFEGIAKLGFNDDLDIIKFMSAEGEEIEMKQQVSTAEAHGSVEKWLLQVRFYCGRVYSFFCCIFLFSIYYA